MTAFESVGCAHQLHAAAAGPPEPTALCVCPAGVIHMLDCPVAVGLRCAHFRAAAAADPAAAEQVEEARRRLMEDYLTRAYHRRVRVLDARPDAWQASRAELAARYAALEDVAEDDPDVEEAYERDRDRLLEARRRREVARAQSEEHDRATRARRMKTVVQRAQEAVAARSDEARLADGPVKPARPRRGDTRRRRRRRKGGSKS